LHVKCDTSREVIGSNTRVLAGVAEGVVVVEGREEKGGGSDGGREWARSFYFSIGPKVKSPPTRAPDDAKQTH
jgi:hypothetical protein